MDEGSAKESGRGEASEEVTLLQAKTLITLVRTLKILQHLSFLLIHPKSRARRLEYINICE